MNLGSILDNGANFGADCTADAQERLMTNMRQYIVFIILWSGVFCYDVLKKCFVRREETTSSSDGIIISRRIFGEEKAIGTDIDDD